jgi:glycosyltransferase involved in cell wall biosynthesis
VAAEPVSPPRVSVVIPVKDRRALLAAVLDGLEAQTYDGFEVIVVDDGSTDGSGDLARGRTVHGRPVTVVDGGGRGAVEARLLGVDHAEGAVLAFTDSDCVPAPTWLERAAARIEDGADLVNGRTRPARPTLPLERSMGSGLEGLYPTCNVLYRRDAFDRAGRFDRSVARRWGFRPDRRSKGEGFGEDTLLAWRVIRAGGAVFPPDGRDMLSRTARVAAFPAMVKDIPELRGTLLRWRWQLGHRTRLPTYLTLAALLTRRPWLIGACLAWWALLRLQELRHFPISWSRRLQVLPVEMGLDVVTAGALVVGSARARSVTL